MTTYSIRLFLFFSFTLVHLKVAQKSCTFGSCQPPYTPCTWTVFAGVVLSQKSGNLTLGIDNFLNEVTGQCDNSSNIQFFLPYCPPTDCIPFQGDQSLITNHISAYSDYSDNSTLTNVTLMNMVSDMQQRAYNLSGNSLWSQDAGVVYVFTDLHCNDTDLNAWKQFTWPPSFQFVVFFLAPQDYGCLQMTTNKIGVETTLNAPDDFMTCTPQLLSTATTQRTTRTIPMNTGESTTHPTTTTDPTSSTTMSPSHFPPAWLLATMIGIPCLAIVCLCAICACCCCKCMQVQKMKMMLFHNDAQSNQRFRGFFKNGKDKHEWKGETLSAPPLDPCSGLPVQNFAISNHYMDIEQLAARNKKDEWEFNTKNLLIHENEVLGAGAFATVYRATVIGKIPLLKAVQGASASLENSDGRTEGAVKRLPAHADEQNRKDFFHEMEFMKRLGYHVHTIAMLGCVSDPWDPLIVVEYCAHGDLLRYVRSHRSDFFGNGSSSSSSEKSVRLNVKQLVSFAWQISDGMSYLASRNFVHRDVAARNILVTKSLVVKVSDFGLCRYTDSALYTAKGGKLPIKWMSPEALKFGEFSVKSDVWSFGVLLWETFSLGETPYNAVQPTDMLTHLEDGNRLPQPQFCPNEIYKICLECWEDTAEKRPTFDEIRSKLTFMLNLNDESYGYITVIKKNLDTETCAIDIGEESLLRF